MATNANVPLRSTCVLRCGAVTRRCGSQCSATHVHQNWHLNHADQHQDTVAMRTVRRCGDTARGIRSQRSAVHVFECLASHRNKHSQDMLWCARVLGMVPPFTDMVLNTVPPARPKRLHYTRECFNALLLACFDVDATPTHHTIRQCCEAVMCFDMVPSLADVVHNAMPLASSKVWRHVKMTSVKTMFAMRVCVCVCILAWRQCPCIWSSM